MAQPARAKALERFASEPRVRVLLLSLRAGGVGLNLVAAQTVYLLDPGWNPGVEEQAIDRVHRIGQSHAVRVKRFLMQHTVEDRILQLHAKKTALVIECCANEALRAELPVMFTALEQCQRSLEVR